MSARARVVPDLLLDAVAVYRLTRLATVDVITEDLRGAFISAVYQRAGCEDVLGGLVDAHPFSTWAELVAMDDSPPKLATLVTCRWCAGWWISVAVIVLRHRCPRVWQPVAEVAACSAAAGLIARLEQ